MMHVVCQINQNVNRTNLLQMRNDSFVLRTTIDTISPDRPFKYC